MVTKIETEERRNIDPTTVCDLLSVKNNSDKLCYMSEHLVEKDMPKSARSARHYETLEESVTVIQLVCINNRTVMSMS
jgi:hypothetical protein